MISVVPTAAMTADPIAALASCVCDERPLITWAVEFASREDPLPHAWVESRDALSMAVTLALTEPRVFLDAMKSIPSARFPNAVGDTLQVLAMLPDAIRARMLPALVHDARRMLRRLPAVHRETLESALCTALRSAAPAVTFDSVVDAMRDRAWSVRIRLG